MALEEIDHSEQHYNVDHDYWNEYRPLMWWYMENPDGTDEEFRDFCSEVKQLRSSNLIKNYEERFPHAEISKSIEVQVEDLNAIAREINELFDGQTITLGWFLLFTREVYEIIYGREAWF
jgi:hypothetical protein